MLMKNQLISAGMIEAKTEAGEVLVLVDKNGNGDQSAPQTKEEIINARFADLRGNRLVHQKQAKNTAKNMEFHYLTFNLAAGPKSGLLQCWKKGTEFNWTKLM